MSTQTHQQLATLIRLHHTLQRLLYEHALLQLQQNGAQFENVQMDALKRLVKSRQNFDVLLAEGGIDGL